MPTRTYYFPKDFSHLERILQAEPDGFSENEASRFRRNGIPPIPTAGTFALLLGISPKIIFSMRSNPEKHYRSFAIRKKDGTQRKIDTPRTYLKVVQWWILDNIINKISVAENIFGFVAGRSAVQNGVYHFGASHILNVDIKDFFPSIRTYQVLSIFESLGYAVDVATMLAELCSLNGRLPQGAPTSPGIANLVLRDLDIELSQISRKAELKYSRYADDLTFSSQHWISRAFLTEVENAVSHAGFELKPDKTRFSGREGRMDVTGVVINENVQPSRVWRRKARAALHNMAGFRRITRRNLAYLHGIIGMADQFRDSPQMCALAVEAKRIMNQKSSTVIGHGNRPILPNGLTKRQADALVALGRGRSNADVAERLMISESAVKKRLQEAFRKIGVNDRKEAEMWAAKHI